MWLAEALFFALMQLGLLALVPLSQEFVAAGGPAGSFYQTLGAFLNDTVYAQGMAIHMWFYCIGGLLWYYLFYRSGYIPRVISLFGLLAVSLGFAAVVFQLLGYDVPILLSPYPAFRAGYRRMAPVQRHTGATTGFKPSPADRRE